jgi:hypothetical protein
MTRVNTSAATTLPRAQTAPGELDHPHWPQLDRASICRNIRRGGPPRLRARPRFRRPDAAGRALHQRRRHGRGLGHRHPPAQATLGALDAGRLALRPDGRLLAGSGDRYAELPSGRVSGDARTRPGPLADDRQVTALAFSPDGTRLAVGDSIGPVTLWDGDLRHRLGILTGTCDTASGSEPEAVGALAFSPDGATLAWAGGTAPCACGPPPGSGSSAAPAHVRRRTTPSPSGSPTLDFARAGPPSAPPCTPAARACCSRATRWPRTTSSASCATGPAEDSPRRSGGRTSRRAVPPHVPHGTLSGEGAREERDLFVRSDFDSR